MSNDAAQPHFTVEDAGTTSDPADLANSGVGHAVGRDEDPVESADEVVRATDAVPERDQASDAVDTDTSTAATTDFVVDEQGTAEPAHQSTDQQPTEQQPTRRTEPIDEQPQPTQQEPTRRTEPIDEQPQPTQQEPTRRTEPIDEQPHETERRTEAAAEPAAERAPEPERAPLSEPASAEAEPEPAPRSDAESAGRPDLSALADADIGHVFDQTNGVIERADGDSDGSAESDVLSGSERFEDDPTVVDAGVHGDGEVPETRRTGD